MNRLQCCIFDLDQTLVDSQLAETLRNARRWPDVYRMVPDLKPYEGIDEVMATLQSHKIPVAIVTSSPRPYCQKVIAHWGWQISKIVAYHDTSRHKPAPDPMNKALEMLGVSPDGAVAFGDTLNDITSAKLAGVEAAACLWGTDERAFPEADVILPSVNDLLLYLRQRLPQIVP